MSQPNIIAERMEAMMEFAEDYMREACGEPQDTPILLEEIRNPDKRTDLFEMYMEWFNELSTESTG